MRIERRMLPRRLEVRTAPAEGDGAGASVIAGYGAVFNSEVAVGSWFREVIRPGAFAPVIGKDADIRSLFNHDRNYVLGRTTAGTCRVVEDEVGLRYEDDVNAADPMAVSVAAKVARGDVTGSSFGFRVKREEWIEPDENSRDLPLRIIHEFAELIDVGPVTFPQYDDTTAEAREAVRDSLAETSSMPAKVRQALEQRLNGTPQTTAAVAEPATEAPTATAVLLLADADRRRRLQLEAERSHRRA